MPNVLFICGDSLRRDHAYNPEIMPNLNNFMDEFCIKFNNAYAAITWTLPAHNSMLWAKLPSKIGVYDMSRNSPYDVFSKHREFFLPKIPIEKGLVPEFVRRNGTATHWRGGGGYVSGAFGLTAGFATSEQWDWVYLDQNVLISDIENLRKKERWFFYSQDYDTHEPYGDWVRDNANKNAIKELPMFKTSICGAWTPAYLQGIKNAYKNSCIQYDKKLGVVFEYLKKEKLIDSTIVVLTTDHGEELWEHGYGGHGFSLYNDALKIPLAIHFPKRKPEIWENLVSAMDIFPTVFCYPLNADGRNIFACKRDNVIAELKCEKTFSDATLLPGQAFRSFTEMRAIVTNKFKFISVTGLDGNDREEMYDLEKDPHEFNNLAYSFSAAVDANTLRKSLTMANDTVRI